MQYAEMKLTDLHLWDKNPRDITEPDFIRLKQMIQKLGLFKPFLIDQNNTILGGNMRFRACKELGIETVGVSIVTCETDTQRTEYALADNDAAGHYVKNKLKEIVIASPDLDLLMFKVDMSKSKTLAELLDKKTEDDKPEVEFTQELLEAHNYVVLYFDNEVDWLNLQSLYPLKTVKALDSKPGFAKMGVGRVVRGVDFINTLRGTNE